MTVKSIDVAEYILSKLGTIPAMKLQKLVYYSQAWSLVWEEHPLFQDRIEAWANGPVVRELYTAHRRQYDVASVGGDVSVFNHGDKGTIDSVLNYYGDKPSQWLSDLTHQELPWIEARGNLASGERGEREITQAAMAEYYGSL